MARAIARGRRAGPHRDPVLQRHRKPTAGFVTADAEFGWRFGKLGAFESAGLAVQLSNLADKRYHEHQTEGVSGNELAAPGRGVALSLNGSF